MSDDRVSKLSLLVVVATIGSIGGWAWYGATHDPELSHKSGWAALQGIEIDERARDPQPARVRRIFGDAALALAGVGAAEGSPFDGPQPHTAWVLLNEHAADNQVLILPKFRAYRIQCTAVRNAQLLVPDADDYVIKYLRGICRRQHLD